MTFTLEAAAVHRARSALDVAFDRAGIGARRKAFEAIGRELLKSESAAKAYERLQWSSNELVEKAALMMAACWGSKPAAPAASSKWSRWPRIWARCCACSPPRRVHWRSSYRPLPTC